MPALFATLLLTLGTLLCAFGLLGFVLNWTVAVDRADLAIAKNTARTGQAATLLGLLNLTGLNLPGIAVIAVALSASIATASLLTRAPMRHLTTT